MKRKRGVWFGYGLSVVGTACAVLLYVLLRDFDPVFRTSIAFGTLYLTVALTTFFGGSRPAIVATLLGCVGAEYIFIRPNALFSQSGFTGILIIGIYVLSCGLIVAHAEARRQAIARAESLETAIEAKQRRLGAEIADKEAAEAEALHQAERFRTMADSAPVLIWMSGPDKELNWYNKPWLEFVGRTLEEEQDVGWGENIHPDDFDTCIDEYQKASAGQLSFSLEYRLRRRDGVYRWVIDNGVPLYDSGGRFTGYIGSCIDVTERKLAEEEARAANEKAAQILENLSESFVSLDTNHRYTYVNAAAERHYQRTREEMLGKTPWEVFPAYRDESNKMLLEALLDSTKPKQIETFSVVTNKWVLSSSYPTAEGISFFIRDITERKLAAQAIEAKEAQLRLITNAVPALISYVDHSGRFILTNQGYGTWFNVDPSTLVGKHLSEILGPQQYAIAKPQMEIALSGRETHFEVLAPNHKGEERWLEIHYIPDFGPEQEVRGYVTLIHDVTDQKRIQETLQYQSDLLNTITENAQSMLVLLDQEGKVTFANAASVQVVGYKPSELVGKVFHDAIQHTLPDGTKPRIEDSVFSRPHPSPGNLSNIEETFVRKDGTFFPVRCSASKIVRGGEVIATVLEIQDITEEKRSLAALAESEARFQSFMDHSPALSWIKDEEGRYIFVNKSLEELNGWRRKEWQGRTDFDVYPRELASVYRANDEVVLSDRRVRQFNETVYENGAPRQLLAIKFPMSVGDGKWHIGGMAIDITESIRAEDALRASEARFQAFMEFSPSLSWIKNQDGQYVFVNRAMRKTFGWAPKDCASKLDFELFPPDVADRMRAHDKAVLEKGDVLEFVEVLPSVTGQKHFLMVSFPMRVGEGQWHVGGKAIDITERVHAEEALAQSERELNDFFENAAVGLHWVGTDGKILRANRTELQMLGYSLDEYVGHSIAEFHTDLEAIQAILAKLHKGESLQNQPATLKCKDGSVKDVLISSNAFMENGEFVHSRCFTRDITDEKRALRALQDSEERFRVLAESIPSIVWTAAPDGTITYANKHWLEYCGITADQNARGWPDLVLHPDDYDRCVSEWTQALKDGSEYEIEVRNRRHDGEYRWFVTRAVPIRDERGSVKSWFGVTTDIHDQKLLQEQLREADKRKDEFLATLAHELRNPLAPIRNAVELLRADAEASEKLKQSTEIIDRQVSHMVRLVDDLLEASRLSRGKLELRRTRTDLATAIEGAVTSIRPFIESMGHRLEVDLPREPIELYADSFRLSQIFSNLLNNAAKYTDPGGRIILKVERQGNDLSIQVKDSGVGIAKEHLRDIFEMFWQATPALERTEGGLGIGLSLVKTLVQLHGGTIEAHSDGPGKGSEFVIRMPITKPTEADENGAVVRAETDLPAKRLHILVVDDNVDSAHTLSLLLDLMGHTADTALDGLEALRTIERTRPEVVLLDIGLPELNGYDVARRIREKPYGSEITLVALSGWGQDSDKQTAKEAGFDVHLTKPVDFTTLENLLASISRERSVRAESGPSSE